MDWNTGDVITLLSLLMREKKTRLQIWKDRQEMSIVGLLSCVVSSKETLFNRWFFISEVPIYKLLHEFKRYRRMGQPKRRDVKRSQSLFLAYLKKYQESQKTFKDINNMILQEINDTDACYIVAKSAKIAFEKRKMVNEKMKTSDAEENEIYQFLGVAQADGIR